MTTKNLKIIGTLFLSVIFLAVSCLYSLSLAISVPNYDNMPEMKYYIQNKGSSTFMGGLDFYSVIHTSFNSGNDMQKWELEYVSDGYYRVKNVYSGYYLTAGSPGDDVTEKALSSSNEAQLWKFNELGTNEDYYWECKITAKSHENYSDDIALVGDTVYTDYGRTVMQDSYVEDTDYYDEWVLIPCNDAYLVGITRTDSSHNHTSALYIAETYLEEDYFDVTTIATSSTTAHNIKTYMQKSHLFVLRCDGGYSDIGTYAYINTSNAATTLHSWEIYNYTGNTGIDLRNCYLAIFAGCYTANHPTQSLPKAAIRAGAAHAIGFENNPSCIEISAWTHRFIDMYTDNEANLEYAAYTAAARGNDADLYGYVIE